MLERARAAVILKSTPECSSEAELMRAATNLLDAVRIYLSAEGRANCHGLLPYCRDVVAAHVAIAVGIDDKALYLQTCRWAFGRFGSRWSDSLQMSSVMQMSWARVSRGVPGAWLCRPHARRGRREAQARDPPGLDAPPGLPPLEPPP